MAATTVLGRQLDIELTEDWTTVSDPTSDAERYPFHGGAGDYEPGRNITAAYSVASPDLDTRFEIAVTVDGFVTLYESDMHYAHFANIEDAVRAIEQLEGEEQPG